MVFQVAFEVISVLAVMTNCALIGMNPEVQKLLPSDMPAVNVVLVFVIVEVSNNLQSTSVATEKFVLLSLNSLNFKC